MMIRTKDNHNAKMNSGPTLRIISLASWAILLVCLSLAPAESMPSMGFFTWDKLLHAASYSTLTILIVWAYAGRLSLRGVSLGWICAPAILFGGLMEICQGLLTSNRTAELGDLLANATGVGAAMAVLALRDRLMNKGIKNEELEARKAKSGKDTSRVFVCPDKTL
jgi:VanZ family protein